MDVRLSEAELEVMEVLWAADAPVTATEVAAAVRADRQWSLATVKSLLSRLLAKNAVAPAKDGRRFLYSPLIARDAYVGAESRRLISRLFSGRLSPLIARLAEDEALHEDDLAEIRALLARLKS